MRTSPTALTVAGSDSGGGAGIQADLKTFAAHGLHGVCAVTAVTAQNTVEVTAVATIAAPVVRAQIDAVVADFDVRAIKTGMLASREIVAAVCDALEALPNIPVVVDPIMVATSGDRLLDDDAVELIRTRLLRRARLVTPNRLEAEVLSGMPITSLEDARRATGQIRASGVRAVVITGGDLGGLESVDVFDDGGAVVELRGPRLESRSTHGTGCTFAAAVTAGLALEQDVGDAVASAKRYVEEAIRHAEPLGRGYGPVNHFWNR
jgi:hydroxymethylpyrimidine/phosphomethylpyrimidine kinase